MWEGSAGEVAEAVDHGAEFRGGETGDLADVEAGAGEAGESGEAVDFFVGVEAALGEAAAWLDGGVAFLPHADKVRAEPCAEGDGLHVVERFHGKRSGREGSVEGDERRSVRDGMAGCKYKPTVDNCREQRLGEGRGCSESAGVGSGFVLIDGFGWRDGGEGR